MRIRILVILCCHNKLYFYEKNIYKLVKGQKTYLSYKSLLKGWKLGLLFGWSISLLLDPDLHSHYGSGSKRAKSMRIHADPKPDLKTSHKVFQIIPIFQLITSMPW
jgi:hypothetical protein